MTGTVTLDQVLDQLAGDFQLSETQLAGALGATVRTLDRWRSGERYPQHESRRRLDALLMLSARLQATFSSPEAVARWLHADSGYLGGLKPVDALQVGRIDAVTAAIEALDSGVFL